MGLILMRKCSSLYYTYPYDSKIITKYYIYQLSRVGSFNIVCLDFTLLLDAKVDAE